MRTFLVTAFLLLSANACLAAEADTKPPKPAGELPEIKELPNPFTFADGSPVRTKEDWARRREEIKALFQDYEYGHLLPKPKAMKISRGEVSVDEQAGVAIQDLELNLENDGKTLKMTVRVAWPKDAKGPVPVIIQSAFGFGGGRPGAGSGAAPTRPSGQRFATYARRGYAYAELNYQQLAPDNKDRARTTGVYQLFDDKIDCGGLMAWAWGMHRVIDALETMDKIDAKRAVVTGHSRYGKAALIAGAFDERIVLTVPSHSGTAGASPYRFIYGKSEELHNIVGAFPYWFRPDFKQFVGKVQRLPVDQHLLLALVAPRGLLCTEGTKDTWINPEGSQLTYTAAKKVYDFLKAGDKISIRYRPVGHIPSNEDLLAYADHVFFRKALTEEFGRLPYETETRGFTWDVPK
jgi:endo-1,4-beta-xylanase